MEESTNFHSDTEYSPVLIPTLCRSRHLEKTISALQRCSQAKQTDLFIALDYPAKDSHWEGYKKILEMLPSINGFRSVNVIKRQINYGASKNIRDARKQIFTRYNSMIFLEDDIEVSPNFLDYINKGLRAFGSDKKFFAICGYSYYDDLPHDDNTFYVQKIGLCPWGYGMRRDSFEEFESIFTKGYCLKKLLNPITLFRAAFHSWSTVLFTLIKAANPKIMTDNVLTAYMFYENKYVVMPVVSLVKNNGFDGSGEHCDKDDSYAHRIVAHEDVFEFRGSGYEHYDEIKHRLLEGKRKYITFPKMCLHIFRMMKHRLTKRTNLL